MSNNRFLEFDSTYRNRNEWPLASEFQIPISQSGRKNQSNALDPVCLSTPIMAWTCNHLQTSGNELSQTLNGTILINDLVSFSNTSDNISFTISSIENQTFQQLQNYYNGLVITTLGTVSSRRRIIGYKYIGHQDSHDIGLITVSSNFPEGIKNNDPFVIYDPSDISDPNNPYFFVPAGRIQKNAYTGYLLYNENLKEYRQISGYDSTTHMISLNTNLPYYPISNEWTLTQNYSIRKDQPYSPKKNQNYLSPIAPFSTNFLIVSLPNTEQNFYKNFGVRIIPNFDSEPSEFYNYNKISLILNRMFKINI